MKAAEIFDSRTYRNKYKYLLSIYVKTRLAKWGNSYAIRVPKELLESLGMTEHTELELSSKGAMLTAQKTGSELDALLSQIEPQKEIEWGERHGKEVW